MIDKSKYYIPSIEEFTLLNFEFEFRHSEEDGNWKRFEITSMQKWCGWDVYAINDYITRQKIRVKYLDREDIESLGFKVDDRNPGHNTMYRGMDTYYIEGMGKNKLTAATIFAAKDYSHFIIWSGTFSSYAGRITFQGTIKNKSELKRILVQLGVK